MGCTIGVLVLHDSLINIQDQDKMRTRPEKLADSQFIKIRNVRIFEESCTPRRKKSIF